MKRGTTENPKFRRLGRRLGLPAFSTAGVLELLWHFTARHAPEGDVGRWDDEDLADAIGWPGEPGELVAALVAEGWLREDVPGCRLFVHDWPEHADDAVHMALARRRVYFADGAAPRLTRLAKAERLRAEAFYAQDAESGAPDTQAEPEAPEEAPSVGHPAPSGADPCTEVQGELPVATPCARRAHGEHTPCRSPAPAPPGGGGGQWCRSPGARANHRHRVVQGMPPPLRGDGEGPGGAFEGDAVAARVEEIRSRLRDRSSDDRNLRAIAAGLPWPEVERGIFDAWGRFRDGQVRNPTAYFVRSMANRALELGIRLPGARAGPIRAGAGRRGAAPAQARAEGAR